MMWQAILLGIIEGLTEFLPVSSTGHLIIAEEYIGFKDTAKVFTVVIQLGAIAAVVWYYRSDLAKKISGIFSGDRPSVDFFKSLVIASLPALFLGFLLRHRVDDIEKPTVVAWALIIGALVLWWADRIAPRPSKEDKLNLESLSTRQALTIGLLQSVALIPGVSRSGASIVGGLFSGLNRVSATAFSFYLGIPVLGLAAAYKLLVDRQELSHVSGGAGSIIVGTIASFIMAFIAISWLLKYISTHSFKLFVYWRLIVGFLVLLLL